MPICGKHAGETGPEAQPEFVVKKRRQPDVDQKEPEGSDRREGRDHVQAGNPK